MKFLIERASFSLFALLCVGVGLYPLIYLLIDSNVGLLNTKSEALLTSLNWQIGFYLHIAFGGLALLTGWSQFNSRLRTKRLTLHRKLGIIYILSVLVSGSASLYIAPHATGGIVSIVGFGLLGILWLFFTFRAYLAIRISDIAAHQRWMIYSYACCFAAVTLRIWLPILTFVTEDFFVAYPLVAWLSWLPNLLVARFLIFRIQSR